MNIKTYISVIVLFILFSNCSNDDAVSITTIEPTSINFIKEDGSILTLFDCINPNETYAVEIRVKGEGAGEVQNTVIEYTINGLAYSMTFDRVETQSNQITLIEGENVAQLVNTVFLAKISYVKAPSEFELVE
ncbi:hypothetical protein [uncultured Aquimarina sp.]|uniref:hypothetical protein n=1 Tax=uncultured Aquimarina sp. TaxID=575652 RepID=UPI00262721BB|nr:hypothetical protein [uncultured Aquimarina sp.]